MIYDTPSSPGDLKAFDVVIDGQSVIDAVTSVDIYQDIYTPTWTAQIFFDDSANLMNRLPIRAGTKVSVKVETDYGGFAGDGQKQFDFVIYRVGDKQMINHMHYNYTAFCADPAFVANQSKRVRRAFQNQPAEAIAAAVVGEELGGSVEAHPADGNLSLVIPAWSPFNALGWLTKVALHKNAADYCFFQTDSNVFAFKSFEQMYASSEERVDITFVQRPGGKREAGEYAEDFTLQVQKYAFQHFDGMAGIAAGLYKNRTVSFNADTLQWEEVDFTYGDDTPADAQYKNFDDSLATPESNVSFTMKHAEMFDAGESVLDSADKWIASRKSAIQKMDSERLVVQIPGSVAAWAWLGKNCQVDLPSQQDMEDDKLDEYRKGRYVIVAICHNIKKSAYATNIELVKKRLEK
ncbi:tail protein [Acidovorax phage ACP17]|uniref:Uncharacterized protein n=1 Tax=Acidovorax phage ACP17 TaxID=2010329 RepID=A0A218M3G3_9CAUD|nr:tail protein [Acidovorax phage ACP17]ASD50579.1 hypothetical protein [Acidovorax phage ACP17]